MTEENVTVTEVPVPVPVEQHTPELPASEEQAEKWSDHIEYASFYARLGAFLVDFAVVLIPIFVVMENIAPMIIGGEHLSRSNMSSLIQSQGNGAIAAIAAQRIKEYAICGFTAGAAWLSFWYYFSATPGKLVFRIRIVDEETGMPPSLKQYIARYFGLILSGSVLGLGFLWVQWNKRRRAWHDMMTNTVVVKKSSLPEPQASATRASEQKAA